MKTLLTSLLIAGIFLLGQSVSPNHDVAQAQSSSTTMNAIAWSPDGTYVGSASDAGIILWSATTDSLVSVFDSGNTIYTDLAWSPDSTKLAVGTDTGNIEVWNISTRQILQTLEGHDSEIDGLDWNSVGDRLYSTDFLGSMKVWDTSTYQSVGGSVSSGFDLELNPTDTQIALAKGAVSLYDAATADFIRTFDSSSREILTLDWSPDGTKIVSGDANTKAYICDATTGETLLTFELHPTWVTSVSWQPNADRILSADLDGNIYSWDPVTGDYIDLPERSSLVQWSPDGTAYAYAVGDDEIVIKSTLSAIPPDDRTNPVPITPPTATTTGHPPFTFWAANHATTYWLFARDLDNSSSIRPFGPGGTLYPASDICDPDTTICTVPIAPDEGWRYLQNHPRYEWGVNGIREDGTTTGWQFTEFALDLPQPDPPAITHHAPTEHLPGPPNLFAHFSLGWDAALHTDYYRVTAIREGAVVYDSGWVWHDELCADGECHFQATSSAGAFELLAVQGYGPGGASEWAMVEVGLPDGDGGLVDDLPPGYLETGIDAAPSGELCDYLGCGLLPGVEANAPE
jgi:WD40 repeat protein